MIDVFVKCLECDHHLLDVHITILLHIHLSEQFLVSINYKIFVYLILYVCIINYNNILVCCRNVKSCINLLCSKNI